MKKFILIAVLALSCFLSADLKDITIDGGQYTVFEGDTLRVYVNAFGIESEMRLIAFQFDLYFNHEHLEYLQHKPGDIFENAMLMANGKEEGLVKVACSHWEPQDHDGTLVELQFKAIKAGDINLQFDQFKMNSTTMTSILDSKIKILAKKEK